ncbi:1-acyl-sn-glycerol-3-phosphate acyltransferase [Advenella sp. WQ 585]|uniref:1-acyl-sn-glycerol-3-phosphate acyltransferase n=1 Tax=Advenella mandrilli TaxID=2800330 RepID=A0ABS1ECS7_9BURK|nr:1-acyl-sn-glycerol-3-phosphate acyltransferase [Advenella mandrilli]MBK1780830.1 1-acyl-sn-glycerol-3-phosphate acyltransferase [Advenella mandrilli]
MILRVIRFSLRAPALILLLAFGIATSFLLYSFLKQPIREKITRCWSWILMKVCGVRIVVEGQPILKGAVMWVANHVSWIDIFILNSCRTTSFIAKSEIRKWPVIGWLVASVGTIFIERGQRHAISRVSKSILDLFRQDACVGLFPEGTTSDGMDMRSLHTSLFEPPLRAMVPIQPVALVFMLNGQRSGAMAFVGEQTLVNNIWHLLSSRGVLVYVRFLEPLNRPGEPVDATRTEIASEIRTAIIHELKKELP